MLHSKHFSLVSSYHRAQPFLTTLLVITSWHLAVPFLYFSYNDVVFVASTGAVMIVRAMMATTRTMRTASEYAGPAHTKQRWAPCFGENPYLPVFLRSVQGGLHVPNLHLRLGARGRWTQVAVPPFRPTSSLEGLGSTAFGISHTLPNTVL